MYIYIYIYYWLPLPIEASERIGGRTYSKHVDVPFKDNSIQHTILLITNILTVILLPLLLLLIIIIIPIMMITIIVRIMIIKLLVMVKGRSRELRHRRRRLPL